MAYIEDCVTHRTRPHEDDGNEKKIASLIFLHETNKWFEYVSKETERSHSANTLCTKSAEYCVEHDV